MVQAAQTRPGRTTVSPGLVLVAAVFIAIVLAVVILRNISPAVVDYNKFGVQNKLANSGSVQSVAFSSDGRTVLIGGGDGSVAVWNTQSTTAKTLEVRHSGPVNALAFSSSGGILASGGGDDQVIIWNMATGERIYSVKEGDPVTAVAFSADGKLLASTVMSGRLYLWDTKTWNSIPFPGDGQVSSFTFSPSGETLATGRMNGAVTLWDLQRGASRELQKRHSGSLNCMAFSPDGKMLAGAGSGADLQVVIWDMESGDAKWTFKETKKVNFVAFSPDNKTLAMTYASGEFRLSDTGTWLNKPFPPTNGITFFSFSRDPKVLLVRIGNDIQLWRPK